MGAVGFAVWSAAARARQVAAVLAARGTPETIIDEELRLMRGYRVARTGNRSVVAS
jgi:hypothetical protein